MEKVIVKYITFTTSEELEDWQKENDVVIINIVPIANYMDASVSTNTASADLHWGCFVTYR